MNNEKAIKEKVKAQFTNEEVEAARKARNAYLRAWRKRNPDKVQAYALKHYAKVGMAMLAAAEKETAAD